MELLAPLAEETVLPLLGEPESKELDQHGLIIRQTRTICAGARPCNYQAAVEQTPDLADNLLRSFIGRLVRRYRGRLRKRIDQVENEGSEGSSQQGCDQINPEITPA